MKRKQSVFRGFRTTSGLLVPPDGPQHEQARDLKKDGGGKIVPQFTKLTSRVGKK